MGDVNLKPKFENIQPIAAERHLKLLPCLATQLYLDISIHEDQTIGLVVEKQTRENVCLEARVNLSRS